MKSLSLEFERAAGSLSQLPGVFLPEIALLGRSNVGKSSLLNCLAGRRALARTSNTPGRTQSLNFYKGPDFVIVDLPGYGYAKVPDSIRKNWQKLIEGYLVRRKSLEAGVLILDARRIPSELDRVMLTWVRRREIEYLAVVTKSDKLGRGELSKSIRTIRHDLSLQEEQLVTFSAKTGLGREKMINWVRRRAGK